MSWKDDMPSRPVVAVAGATEPWGVSFSACCTM